ncbi:MAG: 50S ribosomal protein L22 [Alphaproteobacteria bacterium CG11_big_fil_rev_8_21_14_0_20_44_7]|nr:MAG: 50S ribosomal protein L22 [Alphaproteobacteria bacterium CG11_big_fil_rev_8_21_14_0_20_44_7]
MAQEAKATARTLRTGQQKLNIVAEMIRGMKAEEALAQLTFSTRRISTEVKKCLQSAIANAENNYNMNVDNLYVAEAYTGKSITMKRFRARAKGRGARIIKPFSNITIVLKERE